MRLLGTFQLLIVLLLSISFALAKSLGSTRTLVLLESLDSKAQYGKFLKTLEERGHQLNFKTSAESDFGLMLYEELAYDHLLVLAPSFSSFGGELGVGNLLDFINKGGNVLLAASSNVSEAIRDFAYEFSADFDPAGTAVADHFLGEEDDPARIAASRFVGNDVVVTKDVKHGPPVLFRGVGHRLTGKNPLVQPLLIGAPTTYSYDTTDDEPIDGSPLAGSTLVLVSALQARNNARVVFSGSVEMFSDRFVDAKVKEHTKSGNLAFITQLSKWAFQETGVLKVWSKVHHRENETAQHGIYRIKDDMVYEINLSEWRDDGWSPFCAADMQFEAVMLDPYIRHSLQAEPPSSGGNSCKLVSHFRLPDHYGVFTFKVDYKRHGYTWLEETDTVQVRPFRHDQYPRFLSAAYPYYTSVFSLIGVWVVFSAVFIWNKQIVDTRKLKTK